MNKELFLKALEVTEKIEKNLGQSDFVSECGRHALISLKEYRLDIALDIYIVFADDLETRTDEALEQRNAWYNEYLARRLHA